MARRKKHNLLNYVPKSLELIFGHTVEDANNNIIFLFLLAYPTSIVTFQLNYIITHGKAQQSGRQTGTTAAPLEDLLLLLLDASYSYFALPFCHPP